MLGREVGLLNMREIRQEGILIHYEENLQEADRSEGVTNLMSYWHWASPFVVLWLSLLDSEQLEGDELCYFLARGRPQGLPEGAACSSLVPRCEES